MSRPRGLDCTGWRRSRWWWVKDNAEALAFSAMLLSWIAVLAVWVSL